MIATFTPLDVAWGLRGLALDAAGWLLEHGIELALVACVIAIIACRRMHLR